jgi:hypothetical protein
MNGWHNQCRTGFSIYANDQYEDEDAHLVVFLPEGVCESEIEKLHQTLTKRSTEILLDAGLLILAGVYEMSQQHKRAER